MSDSHADFFQENETRFQQILDSISDLILVKDGNSRLRWANRAFREYYGMSNEQLRGLIDSPVNEPDYTKQYIKDDAYVFRSGQVLNIPFEPVVRHDGVTRTFHTVKSPIFDQKGRVELVVGCGRDVTEQRDAEIAFSKKRALLQSILDSIEEGIIVVDESGDFLVYNPAAGRIFPRAAECVQDLDANACDLFSLDGVTSIPIEQFPWNRAMKGESFESEILMRCSRSEKEYFLSFRGTPFAEKTTGLRGGLIVFRDFTQKKKEAEERTRMERQFLQASKLASLGTLSSGVAHELNNPLVAVRGFAQLIRLDPEANARIQDWCDEIIKASYRMQKIVDHLRIFGRNSDQDDMTAVNVQDALQKSIDFFENRLRYENIVVTVRASGFLPAVWGDATLLDSAFQNLLANTIDAYKDIEPSGERPIAIEISSPDRNQVKIVYSDRAGGLPPEIRKHVFEPFYTTKDVGKGTGLGLSIIHGAVQKQKGTVQVDSPFREGTRFTITLPSAVGKTQRSKPAVAQPGGSANPFSFKPSALLIEDDVQVAEILHLMIQDEFEVEVLNEPADAKGRIEARKYDIIISDLKMPKVSGLDVLKWAHLIQSETPVVILSGHARTDREVTEVMAKGAAAFIEKPFQSPEDIKQVLFKQVKSRS